MIQAVEFQQLNSEKLHDQLTGLPNRQHLERFVASELAGSAGLPCTILLIEMRSTAGTKSSLRNTFEHLFAQSADRIRAALRGANLLFRFDSDKFIALLTQTDALTAEHVARRIIEHVAMGRGSDEDGAAGVVRIGRATAPDDGITLADLVSAAESRAIIPQTRGPLCIEVQVSAAIIDTAQDMFRSGLLGRSLEYLQSSRTSEPDSTALAAEIYLLQGRQDLALRVSRELTGRRGLPEDLIARASRGWSSAWDLGECWRHRTA